MDTLKVKVIIGSTRPGRFGDKPAAWVAELAKQQAGMEAEVLDLRDYPMPFFDEPMSLGSSGGKVTHTETLAWAKKIGEADAFVIMAPEYNHGYPAVLKNALDYAYAEWNNKPVGFVGYGSVGGARSAEQLRLVAAELQMASVRTSVHIMAPWTLSDEQGNLKAGALDQYVSSAQSMLDQLGRWGRALKVAREAK